VRRELALFSLILMGGCAPHGPAPAERSRIYVSDERGDSVVAIDPDRGAIVARYGPTRRPRGLALSPDGHTLYVAVSGSPIGGPGVDESKLPPPDVTRHGVAVIDLDRGAVTRVLKAGSDPETFAVSPDSRTLFVSNEDAGAVSAVPVNGLAPARSVAVGEEPEGVAITRDGARLFVACEASDLVVMLDAQTLQRIGAFQVAGRPRGTLAARDGRSVYVTVENAGLLAVLPASGSGAVRLIDLAQGDKAVRPMGMAETADGRLFVTAGRSGQVLEVDPRAGRVLRRIHDVGARPWGASLTADGRRLVTANGPSGDISLIDTASGKVEARVKVGVGPWGVTSTR
jgi:YVTN family beta-propeller protein